MQGVCELPFLARESPAAGGDPKVVAEDTAGSERGLNRVGRWGRFQASPRTSQC